jgi:hypothetical protein
MLPQMKIRTHTSSAMHGMYVTQRFGGCRAAGAPGCGIGTGVAAWGCAAGGKRGGGVGGTGLLLSDARTAEGVLECTLGEAAASLPGGKEGVRAKNSCGA